METENPKPKCKYCGTRRGKIGFYVIADDLENPKPYHQKCIDKLYEDVMMELCLRSEKKHHYKKLKIKS